MKVGIVTLATTDDYAKGAVVLARSLKKQGSRAELVCMISPDVSEGSKLSLQMAFDRIITIDVMNSNEGKSLKRKSFKTGRDLSEWTFSTVTENVYTILFKFIKG